MGMTGLLTSKIMTGMSRSPEGRMVGPELDPQHPSPMFANSIDLYYVLALILFYFNSDLLQKILNLVQTKQIFNVYGHTCFHNTNIQSHFIQIFSSRKHTFRL